VEKEFLRNHSFPSKLVKIVGLWRESSKYLLLTAMTSIDSTFQVINESKTAHEKKTG